MFTVVIVADIHGNIDAFNAVLVDIANQQYDILVIAGDLITGGLQPAQALQRIRNLHASVLLGNTDRDVVDEQNTHPTIRWARDQLDEDDFVYLKTLPLTQRIIPPAGISPEDDLLVVHATPTNLDSFLILEPHPFGPTFTRITSEVETISWLGGVRASLIVYGHIHYASSGVIRKQQLASIGSAGQPTNGNHRAAYALVSWMGTLWQVTHRRMSYDFENAVHMIEQSDQPETARVAKILREAKWYP